MTTGGSAISRSPSSADTFSATERWATDFPSKKYLTANDVKRPEEQFRWIYVGSHLLLMRVFDAFGLFCTYEHITHLLAPCFTQLKHGFQCSQHIHYPVTFEFETAVVHSDRITKVFRHCEAIFDVSDLINEVGLRVHDTGATISRALGDHRPRARARLEKERHRRGDVLTHRGSTKPVKQAGASRK